MNYRLLLLCCLAGTLMSPLYGQYGLQTGLLNNHIFSQSFNPAYLADAEYETFQVMSRGEAWIGNSAASVEGIFVEGNTISDETSIRLVSEMGTDDNYVYAGSLGDLARVFLKLGER